MNPNYWLPHGTFCLSYRVKTTRKLFVRVLLRHTEFVAVVDYCILRVYRRNTKPPDKSR
jgi:hypothetical protein